MNKVSCGIPTKGRYDTLSNTLLSVISQTVKPSEIIIVDDNEDAKDLREMRAYQGIFQLMNYYKIEWRVIFGRHLGQHHSHQMVQEEAKHPIILRIDDDEIAEKDVLEKLLSHWSMDIGAVGGLVPQNCPPPPLPPDAANIISDLNKPNIQWFSHTNKEVKEVEHLTSSFIYRKGIVKFELGLSPAAFREETLFTYELKRQGFKLLVDPTAITWHFRGENRHTNVQDWENDDKFFQEKLREWGILESQSKTVVLDCGIGDELIVATLIPELKKKYGKLVIACCHNPIFEDFQGEDVQLISIADAKQRLGSIDHLNIYRNLIDWNWRDSLEKGFRKLYGLPY